MQPYYVDTKLYKVKKVTRYISFVQTKLLYPPRYWFSTVFHSFSHRGPQWATEHNSALRTQNPGEWLLAMRWRVRKSSEEFWVPRHIDNGIIINTKHIGKERLRKHGYETIWNDTKSRHTNLTSQTFADGPRHTYHSVYLSSWSGPICHDKTIQNADEFVMSSFVWTPFRLRFRRQRRLLHFESPCFIALKGESQLLNIH